MCCHSIVRAKNTPGAIKNADNRLLPQSDLHVTHCVKQLLAVGHVLSD